MLKVENRFMIKDLYRKGVTISDIARETGHDRKTIRAVLKGPVSPPPQKRKAQGQEAGPLRAVPGEAHRRRASSTATSCWTRSASQGYQGGKSLLKTFVQPYREARRQRSHRAL